jgi:ankyrin repeat protein
MSLSALKRIVARLTRDRLQGTAFLVGKKYALTCAHCLGEDEHDEKRRGPIWLNFNWWNDKKRKCNASVEQIDWDLDIALLSLDEEAPVDLLSLATNADIEKFWTAFGYPELTGDDGFPLKGVVRDPEARAYDRPALLLKCDEGADKINGASGSPIMVDDQIVGILTNQLLRYNASGDKVPAFAAAYACPLGAIPNKYFPDGPPSIFRGLSDFDNAFVDLLLVMFRGDDPRAFVDTLSIGPQVEIRLPGSVARRLMVARETVQSLHELDGVESALDAVERERPAYGALVAKLRELPRFPKREAPPPRPPNPAPPLPNAYVERDCFGRFRDAIVAERRRLVGVTGALGIGKTTFAAAVAQSPQVQDRFTRICWLAPDEGTDQPVMALQAQLFRQLGGRADFRSTTWRAGVASLSDQASETLTVGQRLLIVVDDPPGPIDIIIAALQVHSNLTLLICSENRAALQSLGADPLADPDSMTIDESLHLLARWCHTRPEDLPDSAREVVVAVGGLPLAVALIGAVVSLADDKDAELSAVRKDLAAGRVDQLDIPGVENANLMAIFRRGLSSLAQRDLDDLHALAVGPPDWHLDVQTLRVLWATDDSDDARRRADRLATRSLLGRPGGSEYVLHRLHRLVLRALDDHLAERFKNLTDRITPATPPLVLALSWRDDQIFRLLAKNVDVQEVDRATPDGVTALHAASLHGTADAAKLLLERGADPRRQEKNGFCALQMAAQGGDPATIRLLLSLSLDPAQRNHGGKTALDIAARFGHVEAVRLLSEDARAIRASRYALACAAMDGHTAVVALLLSAGADPEDAEGISPPLLCAAFKGHVSIAKLLLDAGARVDRASGDQTPLFAAAGKGHSEVVRLLIAARADATWKTTTDRTPLHQAAQSGQVGVLEQLIDAGAPVDAVDRQGLTPLHIAASLGHADIVHSLVRHRADLNRIDGDELTPLHRAVHEAQADAVEALLSAGANPDVAGQKGRTPLILAVELAPPGAVQHVSISTDESGTSFSAVTIYTPVSSAMLRIIRCLAAAGVDPNAADVTGQTALHWAAQRGSVELASLLLELGANRGKRDRDGRTPLDLAEAMAPTGAEKSLVWLRAQALASLLSQ